MYSLQDSDQIEDHKAFLEPEHQQLLSEDDHFSGKGSTLDRPSQKWTVLPPVFTRKSYLSSISKKLINSIYQNRTKSVTIEKYHMDGIQLSVVKEI